MKPETEQMLNSSPSKKQFLLTTGVPSTVHVSKVLIDLANKNEPIEKLYENRGTVTLVTFPGAEISTSSTDELGKTTAPRFATN
jgi:hypothetical protein